MWILKLFLLFGLIKQNESFGGFSAITEGFKKGIDAVGDIIDDTVDAVGNAINSAATAITGAAQATYNWFDDAVDDVKNVLDAIESVINESIDVINNIPDIFNSTTWNKLEDGAKLVISKLKSPVLEYVEIGCDFLLSFFGEWLPKPLDRLKVDDFSTITKCIHDNVLSYSVDWTKDVASSYVLMGNKLDFTPMLNIDGFQDELNDTYTCLNDWIKEVNNRQSFLETISDKIPDDIKNYFGFNDMTLMIEISFTSCTLTCGTVSVGFATSINDKYGTFYSVGTGIDTSSIIGASVSASVGIYKDFDIIVGPSNSVGFGLFDLPILPDLPKVIIDIEADTNVFTNARDAFAGFIFEGDFIDLNLGIISAFNMGFELSETYPLYNSNDLKDAWGIINEQLDKDYQRFKKALKAGGFIASKIVQTTNQRRLAGSSNLSLSCPTTENQAGISSQLQLGYINLHDVSFGNLRGNNSCNSTQIHEIVSELCAYESECDIPLDVSVLGQPCVSEIEHYLTVIYSCPYDTSVFDIGCYTANFLDIVENEYFKDYKVDILNGSWETRTNGIAKCAKIARDNGYNGFAIYNSGMCIMTDGFLDNEIFKKYGVASSCPSDGEGSADSMNVYGFSKTDIAIEDLGCFNKSSIDHLEIISFENEHWLTQDGHHERENAISKCAQIAVENEYPGFGLYNNGSCWLSHSFIDTVFNDISNDNMTSCGESRGTIDQYNVYSFPYIEYNTVDTLQTKKKLSGGAIAGIIIGVLIFIAIIIVAVLFVLKKKRPDMIRKKQSVEVPDNTTKG